MLQEDTEASIGAPISAAAVVAAEITTVLTVEMTGGKNVVRFFHRHDIVEKVVRVSVIEKSSYYPI